MKIKSLDLWKKNLCRVDLLGQKTVIDIQTKMELHLYSVMVNGRNSKIQSKKTAFKLFLF